MSEKYYVWWPETEELDIYTNKKDVEKRLDEMVFDGCSFEDMKIIQGREVNIGIVIRDPKEKSDDSR